MKLTLTRNEHRDDGVFGILTNEANDQIAVTLEHAYDNGLDNGGYAPKVPAGDYNCFRSMHRLHGMDQDFETFQLLNVPNHTNILIHWGNYNDDSDGCILVGRRVAASVNGQQMITSSKNTFFKLMDLLSGLDSFTLTIIDKG